MNHAKGRAAYIIIHIHVGGSSLVVNVNFLWIRNQTYESICKNYFNMASGDCSYKRYDNVFSIVYTVGDVWTSCNVLTSMLHVATGCFMRKN